MSRICNFRVFRVFKFAVVGCSGVEIFAGEIFEFELSPYTIIVNGSCRGAKHAVLVVRFV